MNFLFILLSLLPYLCLLGTVFLICCAPGQNKKPVFSGVVDGALIWSAAVWLATNILSFADLICRLPFAAFWLAYFCILSLLVLRIRPRCHPVWPANRITIFICAICLLTFIAAIIYPPNNWDVTAYHLPRVMHWLQNHTLAPYYTNVPRQIGMPPFNSMTALQSLVMGGGDYFVNLGQWFAFAGCIIGVGRLTAQLGGYRSGRAQLYASLFMAAMPTAIAQATVIESTEIATFWIIAFVSNFLSWRRKPDMATGIRLGLCLGFAILTKGSSYPIAFPFVCIIAFLCLRSPRKLLAQGVIMAIAVLLINGPHLQRVHAAYGNILGGTETNILSRPTVGTFAVNVLYNFLVHEPWILWAGGTEAATRFSAALGVDENDPRIFPWRGIRRAEQFFSFNDGKGQNPVQAAFLLLLGGAVILRKFRPPALYTAGVFCSFAAYCLLLTWHPWTGRIHTTLFALASPLCGLYLASWRKIFWQKTVQAALALFAILSLCFGERPISALNNPARHFALHPRDILYIPYERVASAYVDAVEYLASRRPERIAIVNADDAFEYPLWALLAKKLGYLPSIWHLGRCLTDQNLPPPQFIWVQNIGDNGATLAPPFILESSGDTYIQVYPPIRP